MAADEDAINDANDRANVDPAVSQVNTDTANFRLAAKSYFLTYSQVGEVPLDALKDALQTWPGQGGQALKGT